MFDPDDMDPPPDIFGDLGRDALKVVWALALLLFAPISPVFFADLPHDRELVRRNLGRDLTSNPSDC